MRTEFGIHLRLESCVDEQLCDGSKQYKIEGSAGEVKNLSVWRANQCVLVILPIVIASVRN